MNANGQNYADSQTGTGSCLPDTRANSINYDRALGYTLVYTNMYNNSIRKTYIIPAPDPVTSVDLGPLPQGTYNIVISTTDVNPPYRQFTVGGLVIFDTSASFSKVVVTPTSGNLVTVVTP